MKSLTKSLIKPKDWVTLSAPKPDLPEWCVGIGYPLGDDLHYEFFEEEADAREFAKRMESVILAAGSYGAAEALERVAGIVGARADELEKLTKTLKDAAWEVGESAPDPLPDEPDEESCVSATEQ